MRSLRGLVVTGTDTGVGKTHISTLILRQMRDEGCRIGGYKPVCTGASRPEDGRSIWDDLERLSAAITLPCSIDDVCPQRFSAPLAPPIAARKEGRSIDSEKLASGVEVWRGRADTVIIEGVGGWLCPVAEERTFADLAGRWKLPVLVVARRGLGTINHSLLTIESIRQRGLSVAGVILNEPSPPGDDASVAENAAEIERRCGVHVLGELLHGEDRELRRAGQPVRIRWSELMRELLVVRPDS